jgi:hypothetical protein
VPEITIWRIIDAAGSTRKILRKGCRQFSEAEATTTTDRMAFQRYLFSNYLIGKASRNEASCGVSLQRCRLERSPHYLRKFPATPPTNSDCSNGPTTLLSQPPPRLTLLNKETNEGKGAIRRSNRYIRRNRRSNHPPTHPINHPPPTKQKHWKVE